MFALYKTVQYLVSKLSTSFKLSLGHEGEVTILRILIDLLNFKESAEFKYNRWLEFITTKIEL